MAQQRTAKAIQQWRVPGPFSKDRLYFLRYYRNSFYLFLAIDVFLMLVRPPVFGSLSFGFYDILIGLLSIYVGGLSGVFMHNAAHSNFRPRWLNRIVGEVAGIHQLYGFHGWKTAHLVHHFFPDDPEFDPHPPEAQTYVTFVLAMQKNLRGCLTTLFYKTWGKDEAAERIWQSKNRYALFGIFLKLLFWLLLLTPKYFLLVFIPSYLGAFFFFTHFNYFTHRPVAASIGGMGDSNRLEFEILNLNDTLVYRTLNLLLFGVYFHRNHHERANLFNPRSLNRKASK